MLVPVTVVLVMSTESPYFPASAPMRLLFGDYHLRLLSLLLLRPGEVEDAIAAGAALLTDVKAWLARNHR